jgi:uncharacterized membrane-anchored protein
MRIIWQKLRELNNLPLQKKLFLAVGWQVAILLFLVVSFGSTIASGNKIYLRIEPVDPRDPLRGDYVTFQYQGLSSISVYDYEYDGYRCSRDTLGRGVGSNSERCLPKGGAAYREGDTVYVRLRESGSVWVAGYSPVSKSMPREGVFLQGKVTQVDQSEESGTTKLTVSYGIEEYFVPEGVGQNVPFWNSEMVAEVYVSRSGKAVLRRLYKDGKLWP